MSNDTNPNCQKLKIYQEGLTENSFTVIVNGKPVQAHQGMRLIDVLWKAGIRILRSTVISSAPRGMYCGMGTCYDCLVTVNGEKMIRACMTSVEPGMYVETLMRANCDA